MRVIVKKWGNSASIRIPAAIMQAAQLQVDAPVDIREEDGRIVIQPVQDPACDLENLIDAITPENLHSPAEYGPPVGKEAL